VEVEEGVLSEGSHSSALTTLPVRTSCRPMMALTSGALKMCTRVLGTCVPSCTCRPAKLLFILEARDAQGVAGHVVASEPTPVRM
jgi:hypothetical protein